MKYMEKQRKILLIDDDAAFLKLLRIYVEQHFPAIHIETCNDPLKCLALITADLDLMLVDLEMPGLDGAKVLSFAVARGLDRNRIIILSARDADYLHKRFPMGSCLAVLNKFEGEQRAVLDMVFSSLQKPIAGSNDVCGPESRINPGT
jgi:CheY-like chemotaxis protein